MEINVLIDEGLEGRLEASWLQGIAERVLVAQNVAPKAEVSLFITDQKKVQELNLAYRGEDRPTDVLAFSAVEEIGAGYPPFITPPDDTLHLGEVIISFPQAVAQASEHRHPVKREIGILIIHGILHLLGYEHDTPERERIMYARTEEILKDIEKETI